MGNGQLGVGFSLGGLSAIHRCAKTIATDGVKGGVNYGNNDKYCLNGQRLIAISGTDGQSSSEYRTEMNSFSKIKYNGNYWTVKTKSGQTFKYGNTQDSKIEAQGKSVVRLWAVNKIIDATGNAINYVYNENNANGEYTLSSINYANSSIGFTYEGRNDVSTSYQAGGKLRQTKRLSNIATYVDGNLVRDYNLAYQYSGTTLKRSQLQSIQECVNNKCLSKIRFNYNNNAKEEFKPYTKWGGNGGEIDLGRYKLADFNGDGLTDILSFEGRNFYVWKNSQITSKLRSITNGFNIKTTINYKPLTDPSVYTKGTNSNYPNIDTQNARQVVSSVVTDNAIGGQSTTTYKYGNAKINIK
ncbi:SpvB/TcaC N-terminal domain-containing protein, partial [Bathymodiolus thermophilus thioautotrophic gill symbiont]